MAELMDPRVAPFRLDGTNGEAVVLIHGFTGSPAYFRPMAEFLHGHGYTVETPLLAGHGTHLDDMASTGGEDWIASALTAARDVADHRRVHLVGLSMGGLIALLIAQPTGASTTTTVNSPVRVHNRKARFARLFVPLRPFAHTPPVPEPDLEPDMLELWKLTYQGGAPTAAVADLMAISRRAVRAARRLRRPSLVIQSRVDPVVDPISGEILHRALGKESRLVWLEESIHNSLLDRERHLIHDAVFARIGDLGEGR